MKFRIRPGKATCAGLVAVMLVTRQHLEAHLVRHENSNRRHARTEVSKENPPARSLPAVKRDISVDVGISRDASRSC